MNDNSSQSNQIYFDFEKKKNALQRWTLNWNRKTFTKQDNLMSLIYSHDFRAKMRGEAYLLVLQQNSEQSKRKVGGHNLHQLELNTKPT